MSDQPVSLEEAEARLLAESQRLFDKELHPDGKTIEVYISDTRHYRSLPNITIRLWANNTWEYVE